MLMRFETFNLAYVEWMLRCDKNEIIYCECFSGIPGHDDGLEIYYVGTARELWYEFCRDYRTLEVYECICRMRLRALLLRFHPEMDWNTAHAYAMGMRFIRENDPDVIEESGDRFGRILGIVWILVSILVLSVWTYRIWTHW